MLANGARLHLTLACDAAMSPRIALNIAASTPILLNSLG
jgi:hypothetical protein